MISQFLQSRFRFPIVDLLEAFKQIAYQMQMPAPVKAPSKYFETAIDDEIVLMNIDTGSFHSLKGPSVQIWNRIDGTRSTEKILSELVEQYDVEPEICSKDVSGFLCDLTQAGFVVSR